MIQIKKGREPKEWETIRQTPGIDYDTADKTALRSALLSEQGAICGYCMRRIDYVPGTTTDTRIEHVKPRSLSISEGKPEETLSYGNMILCCNGDVDGDNDEHCDRSKAERAIHFSPFDTVAMETITYSWRDGIIKSTNQQIDADLNQVLNLNHKRLAANRYAVIKGLLAEMKKGNWKRAGVEAKLVEYGSKDASGHYKEYCGVVIWFLNKRLRQFA